MAAAAAKTEDVDISALAEYESDDEPTKAPAGEVAKKAGEDTYTTIHASPFKDFLLKPELLWAITDCGFEHPSEVQHECISQAILGTDVICQAKSGMGKTAVFVLAVLQQLDPDVDKPAALIMCHTRELAYQITNEFDRFKKYLKNVRTMVLMGGTPIVKDRQALKDDHPQIIIGTPGRVFALASTKALNLSGIKHFVLDECDRMLEQLDMRDTVQKVFKMTPHVKQVMMFTATLSEEIKPVCKMFMHNPLEVYIRDGEKLTLHGLLQYLCQLEEKEKNRKLIDLLDALEFNQCVIFVRSLARATELNRLLNDCNFPSIAIHSGMPQEERIERYKKFKNFEARIVVATDLFGRGIDIQRINVVFNYDMPADADQYLHRVGRAGRFGTKGLAISFVSSEDDAKVLNDVQKRFTVSIPELPEEIDTTAYMNA